MNTDAIDVMFLGAVWLVLRFILMYLDWILVSYPMVCVAYI